VRGKVFYKGDPSRSEGGKVIKPIMKWMAPLLSSPHLLNPPTIDYVKLQNWLCLRYLSPLPLYSLVHPSPDIWRIC
jgi:hypothetical protein